jgi:23S rRNA (guanosine2251-2'-O)-methyltransferase
MVPVISTLKVEEDLICGMHAVLTALKQHPERVAAIWVNAERADKRMNEVIEAARVAHVKFHPVPRAKLDKLADGQRHQGVIACLRTTEVGGEAELSEFLKNLPPAPLLLILDGVQDPHNFGACLRVADAAGVHAVIVPRDRSAPITAATRRAASGAAETVPIFQVINLARSLDAIKEVGIWLHGAAQDAADDVYRVDLAGPVGLVFGGEGEGLRRLTRERCDRLMRIPMAGKVESLNVSVAAGIVLYEAVRQRKKEDQVS